MPKNESLSKLHSMKEMTCDVEPTPMNIEDNMNITSPIELIQEEEYKPFYGEERIEIVERALEKLRQKEERDKISPVELAATRAQDPYKTLSM